MLMGVAAGYTGRAVSQILVGWIPFLGNAVNASTAGGLTEFVGWQMADRFDKELQAKAKKPSSKDKQDATPKQAVGNV